jgi:hypothetical protein
MIERPAEPRRALTAGGAVLFSLVMFAVLAYAAYEVNTAFTTRARLFANVIALPALVLAAFQVIREARRVIPLPVPPDAVVSRSALIWAVAFFVSMWMIGLALTIPLFAFVYLRLAAGEAWPKAAAYAAIAWLFVELTFVQTLHIPLPAGAIGLPAIIN